MSAFTPDYRNLLDAARNRKAKRMPVYEHLIDTGHMETVLQTPFTGLWGGDFGDKVEFFRHYCRFFERMGYDTVSFELGVGPVMPRSGSLGGHVPGAIRDRRDFERYPWEEIEPNFFSAYSESFRALEKAMPPGMKAVGGPGNGLFECVQDITGYMDLCYIKADDPELYAELFSRVAQIHYGIWERFMRDFSDMYCVLRFGDDLGFRSSTLISLEDIRAHIVPHYRRITGLVHTYGKPFLLHSCGNIFEAMEDLIGTGIDAKHSNEDAIAPFAEWVRRYGSRIGNFGGVDTDILCQYPESEIRSYVNEVLAQCGDSGGIAIGCGNSIPNYVPIEGYLAMVGAVREYRGDRPQDIL